MTHSNYLATKEVARMLNVSHRTLENWRLAGKGPPFVSFGKLVRYPIDKLKAWIEQASGIGGLQTR